jgi:tRNA(Ile)-lysidine synthase
MGSSRNSPGSAFASLPPGDAVCVGFSGGLDSTVLLDLMARHGRETGRGVTAVHVHHGLSPNADAWAASCAKFCAARGVPLAIERVSVERDSREGLEGAARSARYAVYAKRAEPFVALAHHLDDQAETVLLQLLRGTGLKGLAAMPEMRALAGSHVRIYRPFLAYPRAALLEHAIDAGLEWIEDESNASSVHDRNYLRGELAPILDARFPGWRESVARFSRHAASADALLEDLANDDGPGVESSRGDADGESMYIRRPLGEARRANALRSFLHRHQLPMPGTAQLAEMARQIYDARDDAAVRIDHAGVSIVREGNRAYIESRPWSGEPWRVDWHGEHDVALGGARGRVRFSRREGEGIDPARIASGVWHFGSRAGGEKIRLAPRGSTRTLKNVLQERGLSRWQRQNSPCLFHDGRLVWMDGVGIEVEYRIPEGREGLFPCWEMALPGCAVLK